MSRALRHEASDAQPRYAVIGLGALGGGLLLVLALAAGLLLIFARTSPPARRAAPSQTPAPRLEIVGGADLARVRAAGQARLDGYGWSDRAAGLAHIPIARAMQMTAQRGWADAEPAP